MSDSVDRAKQKPVPVFEALDELEAGMIKQLLTSCGIQCVVQGRMASGLYPVSIGDMGKRQILVLEDDADDARELLAEWRSQRSDGDEDDND